MNTAAHPTAEVSLLRPREASVTAHAPNSKPEIRSNRANPQNERKGADVVVGFVSTEEGQTPDSGFRLTPQQSSCRNSRKLH